MPTKLERLGLAEPVGPAQWTLKPGLEPALRDLGVRGDIIKTMHRAIGRAGREPDVAGFALHGDQPADPVLGRLVERGLHDELKGTAYAIVDGVDGRTHHLVFADLELTGDATPGAIVEARVYDDADGRKRLSLATRSDLAIEAQVSPPARPGSIDSFSPRQSALGSGGFGAEVREAMDRRIDHLVEQDLARGRASASSSPATFSTRCASASSKRGRRQPVGARPDSLIGRPREGEPVAGVYRQRVTLASGRFAMIDDGLGFQLVPWRPALEQQLGQHVAGVLTASGVEWDLARKRGLGL